MMPAVSHAQRLPRQRLSPNRQLTHRQSKGEPLVPIVALSDISNNVCGVKVFVFERSGVNSEELF